LEDERRGWRRGNPSGKWRISHFHFLLIVEREEISLLFFNFRSEVSPCRIVAWIKVLGHIACF